MSEAEIPEELLALDMSGQHSIYKQNTLAYIGGWIIRSMRENISCDTCCSALFSTGDSDNVYGLINENDNPLSALCIGECV